MTVLWIVAGACFAGGAAATGQWLPELQRGAVGFAAMFVISGLAGAALATVGVRIDLIVRALEKRSELGYLRASFVGSELTLLLLDSGVLAALALIVYFMAPKPRHSESG
jgi:hypothetical protein